MFIICLTLLAVLLPASSYLTPEDTSLQERDSQDGSLRERWVAEWQPCVESCQHKYGKFGRKKTFECLRQNCPEVTVVRDVGESPEVDVDQSNPSQSLCARLLCSDVTSSKEYMDCMALRCSGLVDSPFRQPPTPWKLLESVQNQDVVPKSRLFLVAEGLKNLCELRHCSGMKGNALLHCAKHKCSPQRSRFGSEEEEEEETEVRKRRVNDDVSQCIQSYCGNHKSKSARLVCIVKACHRSGR